MYVHMYVYVRYTGRYIPVPVNVIALEGDGYIEIDCDVGSSRIASNIISVLR